MFTVSLIILQPVNAHTGRWRSANLWDGNGMSQVGTVNRSSYSGFDLFVFRANHDQMGYKQVYLNTNQVGEHTMWGQPLLDRYGVVVPYNTGVVHDPWFNP